jgi:hypothetical protein
MARGMVYQNMRWGTVHHSTDNTCGISVMTVGCIHFILFQPLIFVFIQNGGKCDNKPFRLEPEKNCKRNWLTLGFCFCSKQRKCERKPFRLELKKNFKLNRRTLSSRRSWNYQKLIAEKHLPRQAVWSIRTCGGGPSTTVQIILVTN